MSKLIIQITILFGCGIFSFTEAGKISAYQKDGLDPDRNEGYKKVIKYQDGFLAAGSGARIDRISDSGMLIGSQEFPGEMFNCMLLFNQMILVAGNHGSIMVSSDHGVWRKIDSGTTKNIHSLALFKGMVVAGADEGRLVLGDMNHEFRVIRVPVKGNIVSVSAGATACFGVSDEGEIIQSKNGTNWELTDFNQTYSGYYGNCKFTRVLVTKNRIVVAGVRDDGSPVLFFSHLGGVWTERHLNYTDDQGSIAYLSGTPNDIFYDEAGDQFFLICDGGKMLLLPSCTQCNELTILSADDLKGIAGNENTLAIAGEHFFFKTLNLR